MKLIQTTLVLVAVLGLSACETETEVMETHGEDAMMDDAMVDDAMADGADMVDTHN